MITLPKNLHGCTHGLWGHRPYCLCRLSLAILMVLLAVASSQAQEAHVHPRLLLGSRKWNDFSARSDKAPFSTWMKILEQEAGQTANTPDPDDITHEMAPVYAFLYHTTRDSKWAELAWEQCLQITRDTLFLSLHSFGLRRAQMLKNLAIAYDFAYPAWANDRRRSIADALYDGMIRVNASMGPMANYSIASNWMGIRYGAVILAALAWDNLDHDHSKIARSFLWDATKRLQDHLNANFHREGWNGESLGYFHYAWTCVGPALIALRNSLQTSDAFELEKFAPHLIQSMHGVAISNVAIETMEATGMKPDLSDDNLFLSSVMLYAQGCRLFPRKQVPALRWMLDYMGTELNLKRSGLALLYALLYYPVAVPPTNPEALGWHTFTDNDKGIVIHRNRFQDENDIVWVHNISQNRVRGHSGPDVNTIRLFGLDVPWIIGAGRTGEIAGQSNFFPETIRRTENASTLGKFLRADCSEWFCRTTGLGSNVNTLEHKRTCFSSFDSHFGAEAVIVVADSSENGVRWRINTPEFNILTKQKQGYTLTAPNGNTMQVRVIGSPVSDLEDGLIRYGGSTVRHNPFIKYKGVVYENSRWIDLFTGSNVLVVITLQPKGVKHPEIAWDGRSLSINDQQFELYGHDE